MISNQAGNGGPARAAADGALVGGRCGPTALRIALGAQLRRLREARNLTTGEAAEAIRATHSKISRLERGRSAARQRDVADLLTLYGVTDEAERERPMALARQAAAPGWWQQYSDILPKWFELYVGLERAASVIRTYEVQFVPGLMQTARTPQRAARSPSCGSPSRTCPTWSTLNSSTARSTSTSLTTSSTT